MKAIIDPENLAWAILGDLFDASNIFDEDVLAVSKRLGPLVEQLGAANADAAALLAELTTLRTLWHYADHLPQCAARQPLGACTCGYGILLATAGKGSKA